MLSRVMGACTCNHVADHERVRVVRPCLHMAARLLIRRQHLNTRYFSASPQAEETLQKLSLTDLAAKESVYKACIDASRQIQPSHIPAEGERDPPHMRHA